jgi:hypothetical protein
MGAEPHLGISQLTEAVGDLPMHQLVKRQKEVHCVHILASPFQRFCLEDTTERR